MPRVARRGTPLQLWRISNHESLSGEGGLRYSAGWHTAGKRIVYLAESPAGAMLEVMVHLELSQDELPASCKLIEVAVPDGIATEAITPPGGWELSIDVSRAAGDEWLHSKRSALARVSSAILPRTWNYLLNAEHPDAVRIGIAGIVEAPFVRRQFPLLSQAILSGASAQIRNMATAAGNLNQRTRCPYFYEPALPCNKRAPGRSCSAREGINRSHAIFGWTDACIATHPSDMCVALAALDARVNIVGTDGHPRQMAFAEYHRLPGEEPQRDNRLRLGELVTSIVIPGNNFAKHSCYLKVRERTSYAFALVSVAAALNLKDRTIVDVRLAMGGVAHKPWRAFEAERLLRNQPLSDELFGAAADAEMQAARPLEHNRFKVELGRRLLSIRANPLLGTDRRCGCGREL